MKKRLLLTCLTIGLLNSTFAQEKESISDLIKSKTFAFIVTKVENKAGILGPEFAVFPNFDAINPSTASIETSRKLTTDAPVASYYLADYYRQAMGIGSYFDAFNIQKSTYKPKTRTINNSIILVQQPEALLLKSANGNTDLTNIDSEELYSYSLNDYKLVSKKRKGDTWLLKYKVGQNRNSKVFYLTISENGSAVLQDQPSLRNTTFMYGKILRVSSRNDI